MPVCRFCIRLALFMVILQKLVVYELVGWRSRQSTGVQKSGELARLLFAFRCRLGPQALFLPSHLGREFGAEIFGFEDAANFDVRVGTGVRVRATLGPIDRF